MKAVQKIVVGLFCSALLISCQEVQEPVEVVDELEKFERFDDFNFKWQNSNVTRIKVIDDRLYYAHQTNPGYISTDMTVNQLCCLRNNNLDFRQSLSKEYIAAVDRSLSRYNIYKIDEGGNPGYLDLNSLFENLEGTKAVSYNGTEGSFDINGTKMLANIQFEKLGLFIFDLEKNTNFVGVIPSKNVVKVEFSQSIHSSIGDRVFKVNAFQDGWIASVATGDNISPPNYLISKEGVVKNFILPETPNGIYIGHALTSDGRLIMNVERHIFISESGKVEDLKPRIFFNNLIKMRLIEDRMVIWNNSAATIYEVENFDTRDPETFNIRKLNNEGIEFSGLNELQVFNGKVFAATSQGLFTKSLEGFWDSAPEPADEHGQAFLDGIEFMEN